MLLERGNALSKLINLFFGDKAPICINPFAPERPVTTPMRIQVPSTSYDVISLNGQGQFCPLTCALCRLKRSFKPYQNEHDSVIDTGEKGKKPCNIDPNNFHKNLVSLTTYLSFYLFLKS